jgi:predicted Zn-dependent peptidase
MPTQRVLDTSHPVFEQSVLPNGVRVVTELIPSVRSISVGAWIATGSRDETAAESGISHFIEHMVFKGTRKRRMHHIAQRMESVGGYLNAFTGKEYTCYFARSLDEHLKRAVDVVCDLVLNPTFPANALETEKDVVIEEMRMYDDAPEDHIFDHFEQVLYGEHPLGRPVIGFPETVRSFHRDDLFDYLHRHYTLGRIAIVLAGNVQHQRVVNLVEEAFLGQEKKAHGVEREPAHAYSVDHQVIKRPVQQAHFVLGRPGFPVHEPRRVVLSVLNTVLGGGMSSRLNQNIREKYGYCYNIYSFANMLSDTGDFGIYMATDASKVERSRKLIFRELEKLVQRSISEQKLNQAKSQLKGGMMLGLESLSNRMMRLGRMAMYQKPYRTLDELIADINDVTIQDVDAVAEELLQPELFSSVVLMPENGV